MRFAHLTPLVFATLALVGITPALAQTTVPTERIITVDLNQVKGPKSTVYRRCVGAGRVAEGLRADWQEQFPMRDNEVVLVSLAPR